MEGAADAVRIPRRVSSRYLAKVAAWSELPRAQVTTARGESLRSSRPSSSAASRLRASCERTTPAASPASRCIRVAAGSGLFTGRAELGHEVVGVATVVGLAELHRAAVAQEAQALDQQPGVALAGIEE